MSILRIPTKTAVSPQDGTTVRLNTDSHEFSDNHDNTWKISDLAGNRLVQQLQRWMLNNFPRKIHIPSHDEAPKTNAIDLSGWHRRVQQERDGRTATPHAKPEISTTLENSGTNP